MYSFYNGEKFIFFKVRFLFSIVKKKRMVNKTAVPKVNISPAVVGFSRIWIY